MFPIRSGPVRDNPKSIRAFVVGRTARVAPPRPVRLRPARADQPVGAGRGRQSIFADVGRDVCRRLFVRLRFAQRFPADAETLPAGKYQSSGGRIKKFKVDAFVMVFLFVFI